MQLKPQHLIKQKTWCATEEVVGIFFQRVNSFVEKMSLSSAPDLVSRIWNCDEMGVCIAVASKSVLTWRGAKTVHKMDGGSGRDFITVLGMLCLC